MAGIVAALARELSSPDFLEVPSQVEHGIIRELSSPEFLEVPSQVDHTRQVSSPELLVMPSQVRILAKFHCQIYWKCLHTLSILLSRLITLPSFIFRDAHVPTLIFDGPQINGFPLKVKVFREPRQGTREATSSSSWSSSCPIRSP